MGFALGVLTGCGSSNEPDPNNLVTTVPKRANQTDFERWLEVNLMTPYNIDLQYRLRDIELDLQSPVIPITEAQSIRFAHILKHACLESYDEVTGSTAFVRSTFPKVVVLGGSYRYSSSGTADEGAAEGGRKMSLFGLNEINLKDLDARQETFRTVHHEFTHVQNQIKAYPQEFRSVTPNLYVGMEAWASKWNIDNDIDRKIIAEFETDEVKELRTTDTQLKETYDRLQAEVDNLTVSIKELQDYVDANPSSPEIPDIEADIASRRSELQALTPQLDVARSAYNTHHAAMEANDAYKKWLRIGFRVLYYRNVDAYSSLNALRAGFISPYASANPDEDFAEIQSFYIMETAEAWQTILDIAGPGASIIKQKLEIVRTYLQTHWKIDLDELRKVVQRREAEMSTRDIDTISI